MKYITVLFSLVITTSFAQSKEDYVWLFGQGVSTSGVQKGYKFDFNSQPYELEDQDLAIGFGSVNASICDSEGNLLFFTNGCFIYNKEYQLMQNGSKINDDPWIDIWWGDCTRGYPGSQDALIVKQSLSDSIYYLFHKAVILIEGNQYKINLLVSTINIQANDGLGRVEEKNQILYSDKESLSYYLTGIDHSNQSDFWLVQPIADDSLFVVFLLNENGVERYPDQNTHHYFSREHSSAAGAAKFSPDGTQYAL